MANKLVNKVLKTFEYIQIRNLFNAPDDNSKKIGVNLLKELTGDLGIVEINNYSNEELSDNHLHEAYEFINFNHLSVEIKNDPYFVMNKGGNKYLMEVREEFEHCLIKVQNTISNYEDIVRKLKPEPLFYDYVEEGVFLIELISNEVFETLNELDTNPKAKRFTHPQQMLLMDRLGIIDQLYSKTPDKVLIADILGSLLNRSVGNTRSYLTFGSNLSDAKGNTKTEKTYDYKSKYNIKIIDNFLHNFSI